MNTEPLSQGAAPGRFHAWLLGTRAQRGWGMLALLLTALSLRYAFEPNPTSTPLGNLDKLNHMSAFSAMAWAWLWSRPRQRAAKWQVAGGLLALGIFIELVQTQIPSRSAEAADVVADMLGVALGLALAHIARRLLLGPSKKF